MKDCKCMYCGTMNEVAYRGTCSSCKIGDMKNYCKKRSSYEHLDEDDIINLIRGMSPINAAYNGYGEFLTFSGNQWNEDYAWNREVLENLSQNILVDLYLDLKNGVKIEYKQPSKNNPILNEMEEVRFKEIIKRQPDIDPSVACIMAAEDTKFIKSCEEFGESFQ